MEFSYKKKALELTFKLLVNSKAIEIDNIKEMLQKNRQNSAEQ